MDNQFAMMLIQSVLADPEGRAGVVETAAGFLDSLGVVYVEFHAADKSTEGGTPREMMTLLVDAVAQRLGDEPAVIDVEVEGPENG